MLHCCFLLIAAIPHTAPLPTYHEPYSLKQLDSPRAYLTASDDIKDTKINDIKDTKENVTQSLEPPNEEHDNDKMELIELRKENLIGKEQLHRKCMEWRIRAQLQSIMAGTEQLTDRRNIEMMEMEFRHTCYTLRRLLLNVDERLGVISNLSAALTRNLTAQQKSCRRMKRKLIADKHELVREWKESWIKMIRIFIVTGILSGATIICLSALLVANC